MKKLFTFVFFSFIFIIKSVNAQWFAVPDTNFQKRLLLLGYGSSMNVAHDSINGNALQVINTGSLQLSNNALPGIGSIRSLKGIEAFINLDTLKCNSNALDSLPAFNQLKYLTVDAGLNFSVLQPLPASLTYLSAAYNQLTQLPTLPSGLLYLHCGGNKLHALPTLPVGLQFLYCTGNPLYALPNLPSALISLYCAADSLNSLPTLPNNLLLLYCNSNQLNCLPQLPQSINYLDFSQNNISCVPNYVYNGFLTSTPNLFSMPLCNAGNVNACNVCMSSSTINQNICAGSSYNFNNQTLTTSGIYYDTIPNYRGCDSIVTLNLTVNNCNFKVNAGADILLCPTDGSSTATSIAFPNTIVVNGGVGSRNSYNLFIDVGTRFTSSTESFRDFDSTIAASGFFLTHSSSYVATHWGDSLNIIITVVDSMGNVASDTVLARIQPNKFCNQKVNDDYVTTSKNKAIAINLTANDHNVYKSTSANMNYFDLQFNSPLSNGYLGIGSFDSTNVYWQYYPHQNFVGNDSFYYAVNDSDAYEYGLMGLKKDTAWVHITVNAQPLLSGYNQTLCNTDTAIVGTLTCNDINVLILYQFGLYQNSFTPGLIWYEDTIGKLATNATSIECSGQLKVSPTKTTLYISTYEIPNQSVNIYDSVWVFVNKSFDTIIKSACNSFVFNNQTLTQSGTYYDTLTNYHGCDSIITLNLSVNPASGSNLSQSICQGSSIIFNSQTLTLSGTYYDTIFGGSYVGCDSIITLNLTVNPLPIASFAALYNSCFHSDSCTSPFFTGSANAASYLWSCSSATVTTSTAAFPTFCFSSAGQHSISVTVTDVNGCTSNTFTDTVQLSTGCVWPGDANNDLVADNLDIFPIGLMNGTTGPFRQNASLVWVDQPAIAWNTNIPATSIDAKYADCNGDGVIDGNDTTAIIQNYGLTHQRHKSGTQNLLTMSIGSDTLYQSTTATILVGLGSSSVSMDSIYGVAFSFHTDPTAIDTNSIQINTQSSWLFANSTDHFHLYKLDKSGTIAHVGLVRNDHVGKSGFGNFVTISIDIITGNIVGRDEANFNHQYQLHCSIDDINILKLDGSIVNAAIAVDSSLILYNKNVGINSANKLNLTHSLIPNPANNFVTLQLNGYNWNEEKKIILMDATGKIVLNQNFTTNQKLIDLSNFSSGIYLAKIITTEGVFESKLIKQ